MNEFDLLLKQEKLKCIKNNINELQLKITNPDKDLILKIENHSKLYGFSIKDIINKIKNDEMYAVFFIKDSLKQNIAEKLQLKLLNIQKLPSSGKNAIYINEKGLLCNNTCKILKTKSLDGIKNDTYFYLKYVNQSGGAQDNQINDVKQFLTFSNKSPLKFIAIIDGDYITSFKEKFKTEFPNVKIMSSLEYNLTIT